MSKTKNMWDNLYNNIELKAPKIDDWLDKHLDTLNNSSNTQILDLGCGFGNDTLYLTQKGLPVLSCDYCENALDRLHHFIDNPNTQLVDMRNSLPFDDNFFKVIITDLTLHYFNDATTKSIIKEIYRVLKIGGVLLCRVNSINELAGEEHTPIKIDNNFYRVGSKEKRYFDDSDVYYFFKDFEVSNIATYIMYRYQDPKHVIEFSATKI
jgi:ubiquinone/menaquinone biosynthesis C-methylase UbiE